MTAAHPTRTAVPPDQSEAERMGYDCAVNGANTTNCHFRLFSSPEMTKAWEAGKRRGKASKRHEP